MFGLKLNNLVIFTHLKLWASVAGHNSYQMRKSYLKWLKSNLHLKSFECNPTILKNALSWSRSLSK